MIAGCGRGDLAAASAVVRDGGGVTIVENRSGDAPDLAWLVDDTLDCPVHEHPRSLWGFEITDAGYVLACSATE